jgi:hypothetical protein
MSTEPQPTSPRGRIPQTVTSRLRSFIFVIAGLILLAALLLAFLLVATGPDPHAPRFVPGPPNSIRPYTFSHYDWGGDVPFRDSRVWIWTMTGGTNIHDYLYDLDRRTVAGELFQGGAVFANVDQSKLLVAGYGSGMTSFKDRLLLALGKLTMGRLALPPTNRVESFWILDLKDNSSRRIGNVSQAPGAGSRWLPSPGFRYGYTVPSTARSGAEFFLCDLDNATFQEIEFPGRLEGWWDEQNILVKDPGNNFVLLDVTTQKSSTLFSAESFANSLQQMRLATNLDPVATIHNWNGREFDFYFHSPTNYWIAAKSYLLKADRTNRALVLVQRDFDFRWGGKLDASGTHYMYEGESGAPGSGGNGGVFLRNLSDNTIRTIIPPDNKGQYAIARFYKDSILYFTNRLIWRIGLNGSNNVQVLPPTVN